MADVTVYSPELAAAQQDSWNEYLKSKEIDKARNPPSSFWFLRPACARPSLAIIVPNAAASPLRRCWIAGALSRRTARREGGEGGRSRTHNCVGAAATRFVCAAAQAETSGGGRKERRRMKVAHQRSERSSRRRAHTRGSLPPTPLPPTATSFFGKGIESSFRQQ